MLNEVPIALPLSWSNLGKAKFIENDTSIFRQDKQALESRPDFSNDLSIRKPA